MTMPPLDELARSARSDLTQAADERAISRPDLAVLRRRGTRRHTASLLAVGLFIAVGAAGVLRLVAGDEINVPVIGDVEPTPAEVDEATDDGPPDPAPRGGGPVTLEFDSGGPEPHTLHLRLNADGDLCRSFAGGTGASAIDGTGDSCGDPPDRAQWMGLSGMRSTQVAGSGGGVQSCESGAVAGNVATVELQFPDGHAVTSDVLAAPEIGDVSWYLTCWEEERGLSTLVVFDEDGRELERSEYIQR